MTTFNQQKSRLVAAVRPWVVSQVMWAQMKVWILSGDDMLVPIHVSFVGSFSSLCPCLPAFLPACLPACLPAWLPAFLPAFIPACLPTLEPPRTFYNTARTHCLRKQTNEQTNRHTYNIASSRAPVGAKNREVLSQFHILSRLSPFLCSGIQQPIT